MLFHRKDQQNKSLTLWRLLHHRSVKEMSTQRDNHGLDSFEPVTEAEVNKILKNLSKKTCSLDVVPT